jgi:hypothetical protein
MDDAAPLIVIVLFIVSLICGLVYLNELDYKDKYQTYYEMCERKPMSYEKWRRVYVYNKEQAGGSAVIIPMYMGR